MHSSSILLLLPRELNIQRGGSWKRAPKGAALKSKVGQSRTPGGAEFRENRVSRAWCWGKHLFDEGKLLEVKHFFFRPLKKFSTNVAGWSTESSGVQDRTFTKMAVEGMLLLSCMPRAALQQFPTQFLHFNTYKTHISQNHNYLLFPQEKLKERVAWRYLRAEGLYQSSVLYTTRFFWFLLLSLHPPIQQVTCPANKGNMNTSQI